MSKHILTFLTLLIGFTGLSQEEVEIIHDPRLDSLVRVQANEPHDMVKGFRIQLTTEKSKTRIDEERRRFINTHPNISTYVIFNSPNYVLKVGDFERKEQALALQNQLKTFPYSFIKEELVYYRSK